MGDFQGQQVNLPGGKPSFSYDFPIFLWFFYGFLMIFPVAMFHLAFARAGAQLAICFGGQLHERSHIPGGEQRSEPKIHHFMGINGINQRLFCGG